MMNSWHFLKELVQERFMHGSIQGKYAVAETFPLLENWTRGAEKEERYDTKRRDWRRTTRIWVADGTFAGCNRRELADVEGASRNVLADVPDTGDCRRKNRS